MKDLSPSSGGPRWRQSGQQGPLAPAAGSERVGKRLRGLAAVLLGRVSPSSRQICHPYAQDHNRISSIRPGKEAFKLLILCRGAKTALPRISSVGSTETNLRRGGRVQKEPSRSEKFENTGGYSRGGARGVGVGARDLCWGNVRRKVGRGEATVGPWNSWATGTSFSSIISCMWAVGVSPRVLCSQGRCFLYLS